MGTHCAYPGHAMKRECKPERYLVEMETGRKYAVCEDALEFVKMRGGKIIENIGHNERIARLMEWDKEEIPNPKQKE